MQLRPKKRALAVLLALFVGVIPVLVTVALPPPGWELNPPPYVAITSGNWDDQQPAWSPDGGTIAYVSHRSGSWGVRVVKPDGSGDRQLTPSSLMAQYPSWNPNSSAVAFWCRQGARTDIKEAFLKNSTISTITNGTTVLQGQPKWSPDGTRLLFFIGSDVTQLVTVDVGNGTLRVIAAVSGANVSADWISPTRVVYSTFSQGNYSIFSTNTTTGATEVIINGTASYMDPVVFANSSRIAYASDLIPTTEYDRRYPCAYLPGDFNLWVINLDGFNTIFQSGPVPIAHGVEDTFDAPFTPGAISPTQRISWNHAGTVLAYVAYNSASGTSLYLWDVRNRRSTITPVGPLNANCSDPTWSPDNVDLAFASMAGGFNHISVLNTTNLILQMPTGEG